MNLLHRSTWNRRVKYQAIVQRLFSSLNGLGSSVVVTNVFPDDSASAAGVRTRFLLERLGKQAHSQASVGNGSVILTTTDKDWQQTPSGKKVFMQEESEHGDWIPNLKVEHLPMNRTKAMDAFLSRHKDTEIKRIIFDRFYVEEAFSHAFWQSSTTKQPKPAMILDMQDMHSLRYGRQEIVRQMDKAVQCDGLDQEDPLKHVIPQVMAYVPPIHGKGKDTDRLLRELATIHRCDLTLVCSPYEMDLLHQQYQVPMEKLCLASFFVDSSKVKVANLFGQQEDDKVHDNSGEGETKFIFCGGFLHDPNVDAVQVLLQHIWPKLQQITSNSNQRRISLHIHGAYCPNHIRQWHSPQNGIFIHGYTPRLQDIFDTGGKNILLAPLRFGAGIKGKILDAWCHGMPVVTTPIGSEGILVDTNENGDFGGVVCSTVDDFCNAAMALVRNRCVYSKAQRAGFQLLRKEFDSERNWNAIAQQLHSLDTSKRRERDPVQAMLWHQSLRSTQYFSKWIEEKETTG